MSGLFKIPKVPANAGSGGEGGPAAPAAARPRVGISGHAFSGRRDAFGSTQRFYAPQSKPVEQSKKVGGVVGNSTRNLMDMDDTLLNAVDLDGIEQRMSGAEREEAINRNKTVMKEKRHNMLPPIMEAPKRKKSRLSNITVLQMDTVQEEGPSSSKSKPTSVGRDISRLDQTRTMSSISAHVSSIPWSSSVVVHDRRPVISPASTTIPPAGTKIPKEVTVDLFDWESQAFREEVEKIIKDKLQVTEEEDEPIPCYQQSDVERKRVDSDGSLEPDDGELMSSSQLFLEEVDRMRNRPLTQRKMTNSHTCSQYIRLERTMVEENQINLADDQVDSQLAREFDCSQHWREMNDNYQMCERTLVDVSNIDLQGGRVEDHAVIEAQVAAAIDWEEDVSIADTTRKPPKARLDDIFGKSRFTADSPKRVAQKPAPLVSSHFQDKGPFFGLPSRVRSLLEEYRGIKEMYDWQKECLGLPAIVERRNLIYALPTSGGKTLVAEILMFREILLRRRNVMFVVPYVSLAQEKMTGLSPFAVAMEFLIEEYSGGKGVIPPRKRRKKQSIFVCTIEKALVLLDSLIEADRANEIGLVVVDELHMIGEPKRGVSLEVLLTKILAIKAGIQIVGMSATIGNLNEIAKFMTADIYCRDFRPVELKEYVKCGVDLLQINHKAKTLEDAFVNKQTIDFGYADAMRRVDPDHLIGLVLDVIPADSCLIFCPTKRHCEQLCTLLIQHLPQELAQFKADEKKALIGLLKNDESTANLLPGAFRLGIAYHHSGLTYDERKLIEDAYRTGVISLIICTSTLAAGVNLPAKRVIIRTPFIATNFLTLSRYKQMVGRAGRAGYGECGESIMICAQKDITAVCNLLCSPMDEANSSLHSEDYLYLKNLILSAIGLGICSTRNDIQNFVALTLLAIQAEKLGVNWREATDIAITTLYKENAIKAKSDGCLKNPVNMTIRFDESQYGEPTTIHGLKVSRGAEGSSQEGKLIKTLNKSSRLEVNRLGKATIRAGFTMDKAIRFYDEMIRVGERLNVQNELHLLYIIVLEDGGEIRPKDYVSFFTQLTPEEMIIAKRFHIGEYTIAKILGKKFIPLDLLPTIRRFYRVLILHDLWNLKSPQQVALKYNVDAGSVQTLMSNAASTASGLHRLCEELPELWAFKLLLLTMVQRLSHCCTTELLPLMELPAVKVGRAKQLYRAGFTSLALIAKAKSRDLVESVEHMSYRTANQLILSAKAKLMEEVEALRDQMEDYMHLLIDPPRSN
ncbi:helicase POLQ-like isoform X2 [Ochlerotatus camptorhynchus]